MDIAQLSGIVLIGTQFIKRVFLRFFNIEIKKTGSVITSIITSIAVMLYQITENNLPVDFNTLLVLIQVIIISNTAHNLIRGNN